MGGVVGMGGGGGRMDVHRPTLQTPTTPLRFFASRPCLVTPEPRQITDKSLFSVRGQKWSAALAQRQGAVLVSRQRHSIPLLLYFLFKRCSS